jgi:peptide/nickel transport system permease protein
VRYSCHLMLTFLGRRLLLTIPTLLGVAVIVFLLMRAIPGDVVTQLVGVDQEVSPERMAELRRIFGLDLPIHVQFGQWLGAALQGDLGTSLRTGRSIFGDLMLRFPATLQLALMSLAIALAMALPLGILAARYRGRWPDYLGSAFVLVGLSIPSFFLGILLILLFSLRLGWLPPAGFVPFSEDPLESMRRMILPALSLGLILAAATTRIMRSTMLEVLNRDYVRTARAKGLTRAQALRHHALRNALIPVLTILGLQFSFLLAGAIIIENVFFLPGLGRLIFQAISQRDLIVVESVVMLLVFAVILVTFLVDLAYAAVDPRLRRR